MKYKKYIISLLVVIFSASSLFFPARIALADCVEDGNCPNDGTPVVTPRPNPDPPPTSRPNPTPIQLLKNPLKVGTIAELLDLILQIVTIFAVPIIIFFIIYSGFLFVTAQGKPDQITKARNALLWSVIGGVIILGAHVLLAVIRGTIESLQ